MQEEIRDFLKTVDRPLRVSFPGDETYTLVTLEEGQSDVFNGTRRDGATDHGVREVQGHEVRTVAEILRQFALEAGVVGDVHVVDEGQVRAEPEIAEVVFVLIVAHVDDVELMVVVEEVTPFLYSICERY